MQIWTNYLTHNAFYITVNGANYCLDWNPSKTGSAGVHAFICDANYAGASQQWSYDGIHIQSGAGKCMTETLVYGAAYSNVRVSDCMPAASSLSGLQQFKVEVIGSGVRIVNNATNQCLQMQDAWALPIDAANTHPIVIGMPLRYA